MLLLLKPSAAVSVTLDLTPTISVSGGVFYDGSVTLALGPTIAVAAQEVAHFGAIVLALGPSIAVKGTNPFREAVLDPLSDDSAALTPLSDDSAVLVAISSP